MPINLAFPEADQKILFPYPEALGHGGNFRPVMLSGRNPSCNTTLVDIWGMNIVKTLPSVAYTLAVISDNVNDTSAGTGAQQVLINYLDANYMPHTAQYSLNGQTAVTVASSIDGGSGGTVANCLRINQCEVVAVGTGGANAGNVYACDSTNTYTAGVPQTNSKCFDMILIGDNLDSSSSFTVPAGYRFMTLGILPALNDFTATAKFGKVQLRQTTGNNGIFLGFDLGTITSNNNPDIICPPLWPIAEEMSELKGMANASAATEASILICGLMWKWR